MVSTTKRTPQTIKPDPYTHCPLCGSSLEPFHDQERQRKRCPTCGWIRYRNPTVGVALLIIQDGKVLLGQRSDHSWCIPCGHVEWDEDILRAAEREAMEELGVEVSLGEIVAVHSNFHDRDHHTVGIWFEAKIDEDNELIAGGDLKSIDFFPLKDLPKLSYPTDRLVLEDLQPHIK